MGHMEDDGLPISVEGSHDAPLCSIDQRRRCVSQGRGYPVAFSCSNSKLFIATSRNFVIKHDEETGSVVEVEISTKQDCRIRRIFVDPMGENILVLVHQGIQLDIYYINDKVFQDGRPFLVKDLKDSNVTSVSWYYRNRSKGAGAVIGTDAGMVYGIDCISLVLTSHKVEKLVEIPRIGGKLSPIAGLAVIVLGESSVHQGFLVLVLCGTHLHLYRSMHSESVITMFQSGNVEMRLFDLPIEHDAAQLQLFRPQSPHRYAGGHHGILAQPLRFAVLSASGIYYGKMNFRGHVEDPMDYLVSHKLLPAAVMLKNSQRKERPISLALTQYHMVILYPSKVQIINIESRLTVQEIMVDSFAVPIRSAPALPLGLTRDAIDGQLLVLAGDDIYEIDYSNEDRDMWKIYLLKGDFSSALSHCRTSSQRNAVYIQEAERLFEAGEYEQAASLFGKSTSKHPKFDEIATRLMGLTDGNPMRKFLEARLETLGKEDRIQGTLISAWLLELLLDKANKVALECAIGIHENPHHDVQVFLKQYVDFLDPGATVSILQDYGRNEELIVYARARGDELSEVELLIQQGEAERAINILRKPSMNIELLYKYSRTLLNASPVETVSLWMSHPHLDPVRLIPSMIIFADIQSSYLARSEAIRFIKFCMDIRKVMEPSFIDFGISLLAIDQENEAYLLEKLNLCRNGIGKPLYDPVRALRRCVAHERKRATVYLLIEVSLWKDAVEKALEVSLELAKSVAKKYNGHDKDVEKDLWLTIIKSILHEKNALDVSEDTVETISEIVNNSNDSVSVDDILYLFPDFQHMGRLKSLICDSLSKYGKNIRNIQAEIKVASESNTKLRNALSRVAKPSVLANASFSRCCSCSRLINERPPSSAGPSGGMMPTYYVFPTGNMYHGACLCSETIKVATAAQKKVIRNLANSLVAIQPEEKGKRDDVKALKASLDYHVSMQDPFCGENVSRYVTEPFLNGDDFEKDAWAL